MTLQKQTGTRIILLLIAIIMPFFFGMPTAFCQARVKAPVKLKIEDGDFDGVSVVLKNNTTGESNSLPGSAKFDVDLKINSDYIISFSKPGYITKRIAFNTVSPTTRTNQGFYPFNFEVNLFKQYDGVNIVVFNQPVGKISFNRLIDDFDYDTDYTKQIQSALKLAEDEIKKKQQEERALTEQNKKQEEKRKQEEAVLAKANEKAQLEATKKAAEEARLQVEAEAKAKKAEEDQRKVEAKATLEEEKKLLAVAKLEEEERAKLKAAEDAENRPKPSGISGNDGNAVISPGTSGSDPKPSASASAGDDKTSTRGNPTTGDDKFSGKPTMNSDQEFKPNDIAEGFKNQDSGIKQAKGTIEEESKEPRPSSQGFNGSDAASSEYEKLPDISVEEIEESARKIIRVTVRKNQKETVFSKVIYKWGGVFYFRSNLCISENLYKSATGLQ